MGKIANVLTVVRNNWKKSLLAAGLVSYGVDYGVDSFQINRMMRAYCQEAVKFGNEPAELGKLRRITVILNPAANNKKAKKMFDSYCAPLLHLSGVFVEVLETKSEGHARDLVNTIEPSTDAIIVAGGDGTLSEILTGLMRTKGELCKVPIGVLPLGNRSSVAKSLFEEPEQHRVAMLANATLAIVNGKVKPLDAFRVEVLDANEPDEDRPRPVYGVGNIEWGLRRELRKRADSLWWMGPLKDLAPLIFHGPGFHIGQNKGFIEASIRYSPPCSGCNKCYQQRPDLQREAPAQVASRWWNIMSLQNRRLATQNAEPAVDYSAITNEACSTIEQMEVTTSDIHLVSNNSSSSPLPSLFLKIGPLVKNQGQLVTHGLKLIQDDRSILTDIVEAKQVEIRPKLINTEEGASIEAEEDTLSIDNEDFEVRPIRVSILPNSVKLFCK